MNYGLPVTAEHIGEFRNNNNIFGPAAAPIDVYTNKSR